MEKEMSFPYKCLSCLVLLISIGTSPTHLLGQPTRQEFFEKITMVEKGMSIDRVREILGDPDDKWTREDPNAISNPQVSKVWCFGSQRHLGFPTLGRIDFDDQDEVYHVWGKMGRPIISELKESRIRELMQLIQDTPTFSGGDFNPYKLVSIANEFQPLGQKSAFSIFREYRRVSDFFSQDDGIFLLVLCLHDLPKPPIEQPRVRAGHPGPDEPSDHKQFPRFPLHFVDEIPILMVRGFTYAGRPSAEYFLKQFEDKLTWIITPLKISSKTPKQIHKELVDFRDSKLWYFDQRDVYIFKMFESQLRNFTNSRESANTKK